MFVKPHRLYNSKSELECKVWAVSGNVESVQFIDHRKSTTRVQGVNSEGGSVCTGTRALRGLSVLSTQFCPEPKPALITKAY